MSMKGVDDHDSHQEQQLELLEMHMISVLSYFYQVCQFSWFSTVVIALVLNYHQEVSLRDYIPLGWFRFCRVEL